MRNILKWVCLVFVLPSAAFAWKWTDLWQTADQQGAALLQGGKAEEASHIFKNKDWQGVAFYRARNYSKAMQTFKTRNTSDDQYNAGNAAANLGHYQEAIDFYDKAIALNPHNTDAITNRDIIKKIMKEKKPPQPNLAKNAAKNNANNDKDHPKNNTASSKQASSQNQSSNNNDKQQSSQKREQQKPQAPNEENKSPSSSQMTSGNKEKMASAQENRPMQSGNTPINPRLKPQEEDKKQLLRRLADDPGGLLRQKFLRDYVRRHRED